MGAGVIETFPTRILQGSSRRDPVVMTDSRAVLGCGCAGYVGIRMDKGELVTVLRPCTPRHDGLMQRVQDALIASTRNPTGRPLVEVVDELLTATAVA